jgi:CRISPR-associated protein Csx17
MGAEVRLPVLALPGLSPDSLGNYLASLGLLRVLSRTWPSTRIAWRAEVLQVVGGPPTLDALLNEVVQIASERAWTPYVRRWADAQKKSSELAQKPTTKATSGVPFALWQAEAAENLLDGFTAHVVAHGAGRSMNPILGKAGKIGQRDFAKGWARAADLLAPPKPSKQSKNETPAKKEARAKTDAQAVNTETARKRNELEALLRGTPTSWLERDLNAATWFSHANKLYNNGQRPFRDGLLSPWLMALACEGVSFLAGGSSRRFGARARAVGAFPFVTKAAASEGSGQAERDTAELWAPVWERPMAVSEVVTLFRRGRAELAARSVETPAAFASAILRRGVDAGVMEFRRFVLGWTTAQDYVEPRFQGAVVTPSSHSPIAGAFSKAIERVTMLIEHRGFPRDGKRFSGIRGPIEATLLDLAADPNRSEAGLALLDAITTALDRIDRNRGFREGNVRWTPLPLEWLRSLFADEQPGVEARLALSLVSSFPVAQPFATFRFGVEWQHGAAYVHYTHVDRPPARWVWGPGELARVLGVVLARRLLDQETEADEAGRDRAPLPATSSHVSQWLDGNIDESLLSAWLSRLALFDWRHVTHQMRALVQPDDHTPRVDAELALLGLMQPLVDQRALLIRDLSPDDLLSDETGARTTEAARSLVTLIRAGSLDAALQLASSRYAMAGARLASFDAPFGAHDPDRLVAALLFPIPDRDRAVLFQRWLRPRRRHQGGDAHV